MEFQAKILKPILLNKNLSPDLSWSYFHMYENIYMITVKSLTFAKYSCENEPRLPTALK